MLFVEEEGHGEIPNLLLGVLVRRYEVDSFEMAEIDVPAEDVYVQKLDFAVSDHNFPVMLPGPRAPCRHISSCGIH